MVSPACCPPGDPVALAAALNRLFDDQPLRQRFECAACARIDGEFSAEERVARSMQLYRDVLNGGHAEEKRDGGRANTSR
jgi:glycosyltransferase involved in cell wall biosynthesis